MTRFFANIDHTYYDKTFTLTGEDAAHCYVLRLKPGDPVVLCNGSALDYDCTVASVSRDRVELNVGWENRSRGEPYKRYRLFCAFPKSDKAEHIVQKATELGAASVTFFPSTNCVARYDAQSAAKKLERWRKIAKESAQQSQRGVIPSVNALSTYGEALIAAAESELTLFCYENAESNRLRDQLDGEYRSVAIITGSEGGFTDDEVRIAERSGCRIVSLGTRILRCETAPLAALSAFMLYNDED